MNLKKYVTILLFFIFITAINLTMARSPAVEPVSGISIDNQKIVSPQKIKSFNFSKNSDLQNGRNIATQPIINKRANSVIKKNLVKDSNSSATIFYQSLIVLIILLLPIIVWAHTYSQLKQQSSKHEDNLHILPKKNSDNESNGDEDLPKAS